MLPSFLTQLIQQWLHMRRVAKQSSLHTLRAYHYDVQQFYLFLQEHGLNFGGYEDLESIHISDLRSWLSQRHASNYHKHSTARSVASVRAFYRYLLAEKMIQKNPLRLLRTPKKDKLLPKPLSEDQTQTFLETIDTLASTDWIGQRDKALFTLIYATGLRIGEALSLKVSDVRYQTRIQVLGKRQKQRIVPILPIAQEEIERYLTLCPYALEGDNVLFVGKQGKPLNPAVAQKTMQTYRRMKGLPDTVTPHALRHSCASHLMESSFQLREIQELLGHSSLSSTQVYVDIQQEKLKDVLRKKHPRYDAS